MENGIKIESQKTNQNDPEEEGDEEEEKWKTKSSKDFCDAIAFIRSLVARSANGKYNILFLIIIFIAIFMDSHTRLRPPCNRRSYALERHKPIGGGCQFYQCRLTRLAVSFSNCLDVVPVALKTSLQNILHNRRDVCAFASNDIIVFLVHEKCTPPRITTKRKRRRNKRRRRWRRKKPSEKNDGNKTENHTIIK